MFKEFFGGAWFRGFGLLTILLSLTGCLEYDAQTLRYRYDKASDTLLLSLDYEGFYGTEYPDRLNDKEIARLRGIVEGHDEILIIPGSMTTLGLDDISHALDELESDLSDASELPAEEAEMNRLFHDALKVLETNTVIEGGALYLDADGRLCAEHKVRIGQFSVVVAKVNDAFRAAVKAGLIFSENQEASYLEQLQEGVDALELLRTRGNQIVITVPVNEVDWLEGEEELKAYALEGVDLHHEGLFLQITLGRVRGNLTEMHLKEDSSYRPNALTALEALPELTDLAEIEAARAAFLAVPKKKRSSRLRR